MAFEKKEITMLERFEKYAKTKSTAKRVYNLVSDIDFSHMSLCELSKIPGMGRAALLLVTEVACDLLKE